VSGWPEQSRALVELNLPSRLNREWGLLCDTAPDRRAVRDWAAPSRDRAAPAALVGVDGLHAAVRLLQRRGRANDRVAADPTRPASPGRTVASTSQSPAQRARADFPVALHASLRPPTPNRARHQSPGQPAP